MAKEDRKDMEDKEGKVDKRKKRKKSRCREEQWEPKPWVMVTTLNRPPTTIIRRARTTKP